jgi:hypothetical protein
MAINEAFGWAWVVLGFVTGAMLGMGFSREGFLGGYDSWRRRLVRLGHIALIALGVLNILFAHSAGRFVFVFETAWVQVASWSLIAGAVLMPAACVLVAFVPRAKPVFVLPIVTLVTGASITAIVLVAGALS